MSGLEISFILIGILSGNFGAVLVRPLNIGLFWNSVTGGFGALTFIYVPRWFDLVLFSHWSLDFLAAAAAGMAMMLVFGVLTALRFR